jgi:hypothetical protein
MPPTKDCGAHLCTVTVTGIWNDAPWHPLAEVVFIEAPPGRCTTTCGPLATAKLTVWVGTDTPVVSPVLPVLPVHAAPGPVPPLGDTFPVCVMLTMVTG